MRLRSKMMGILRKIENGEVDAMEYAQLHNFVATMLMLLTKVQPGTLDAAKKEADLAAWLTNSGEDWAVYEGNKNDQ
jgi:hypothetical protein